MNSTELVTDVKLSDLPASWLVIGGIGSFLILIYLISVLVTFPLYVYVRRLNRKTDEIGYFSPITEHFYKVICSMQFFIYVTFSIALVAFVLFDVKCAGSVLVVSFFFAYFVAVAVTSVQNVLLFVLAFRRFMILFLPNFKKIISIDPVNFKWALRGLYLFYVLIQIVSKIVKITCGTDSVVHSTFHFSWNGTEDENRTIQEAERIKDDYDNCTSTTDLLYVRVYILGDVLVMLAAVLYGIMFIKVRRWSRMAGDPLNHPEKYLFYQTILITITKLLGVGLILSANFGEEYNDNVAFTAFVISDVSTTPFVIQVSYLFCNRSNVDAVFSIQFRRMRTWLVLICGASEPRPRRRRRAVRYERRQAPVVVQNQKVADQNTVSNGLQREKEEGRLAVIEPVVIILPSQYLHRTQNYSD